MAQHQILLLADTDTIFDLATTTILDTAYDRAIAELHDRGPDSVREAVARRIVTLASSGERDPNRLCEKALVAVGFLPR
jgi:hypothetical protein